MYYDPAQHDRRGAPKSPWQAERGAVRAIARECNGGGTEAALRMRDLYAVPTPREYGEVARAGAKNKGEEMETLLRDWRFRVWSTPAHERRWTIRLPAYRALRAASRARGIARWLCNALLGAGAVWLIVALDRIW